MSRGTRGKDKMHISQETIDLLYLNEFESVNAFQ